MSPSTVPMTVSPEMWQDLLANSVGVCPSLESHFAKLIPYLFFPPSSPPAFMDMADGKVNGQKAFMSGKLKVKGNIMLATSEFLISKQFFSHARLLGPSTDLTFSSFLSLNLHRARRSPKGPKEQVISSATFFFFQTCNSIFPFCLSSFTLKACTLILIWLRKSFWTWKMFSWNCGVQWLRQFGIKLEGISKNGEPLNDAEKGNVWMTDDLLYWRKQLVQIQMLVK